MSNATSTDKAKAKEQITKSIRDLIKFNITLPLGNPNYKLIHTNKFITTYLPEDFVLENFAVIGEKLNSSDTRYSGYTKNKWYVEAVTINNDGSKATMDLELNPFASSFGVYRDERVGFETAYTNAVEQAKKTSTTTTKTTTSSSKKSTKTTGSKTLNSVVDKAIKGKKKDLDKAKAIDKAFKNHVFYSYYSNAQKTNGKTSKFESAWKNAKLNCADGANLLCAMFNYAGLTATIIHTKHSSVGHYIVRVTINGKYYYTDNAARTGSHTTRAFNKVWENIKKGTNKGKIVT